MHSLYFQWRQWNPDPELHHVNEPCGAWKRRDYGGESLEEFMPLWERWCKEYPRTLRVVTLAPGDRYNSSIQFRLWFGEPHSIRPGYVDSAGRNLIVHFSLHAPGNVLLVRLFAEHLLKGTEYTKEMIEGVEVWRVKHYKQERELKEEK